MKTRLPKTLLATLCGVALAGGAHAVTLYPSEILDVATGETVTWTDFSMMQGGDAMSPFVKDGDGTLRLEGVEGSRTNYYKAPLVVREGKTEFVDSKVYAHGAYNSIPAVLTWVMVGGKNSELSFSNSSFNIATGETHMNIGTADGNGVLTLDNKSDMKVTGSVYAGYHSYANNEDGWGLGWYYNQNGTAAQTGSSYTTKNPQSTIDRYTEGIYTSALNNYNNRQFGEGTVNVLNGSKLDVATGYFMGYSTLNVSGKDSSVIMQTGYGSDNVADDSGYGGTYCLIMGRWSGGKSTVNVTDGATMTLIGQLRTQYASATESIITVDGEGSRLQVNSTAKIGLNDYTDNSTSITVTNGGEAAFARTEMTAANVSVTVDKSSSFCSDSITVSKGVLSNAGKLEAFTEGAAATITVAGGSVTNSGSIKHAVTMSDGEFVVLKGGSIASLKSDGGTFAVSDSIDVFGDVSLSGTEFVFTDGAVIDLNGNDFAFGEGSSITIIMEQLGSEVVMTAATDMDYTIQGITFDNAGMVTGLDEDIQVTLLSSADDTEGTTVTLKASDVTIKPAAVPEPTTAALSLLALASLAARRRRR